jgi:hypothetical protein
MKTTLTTIAFFLIVSLTNAQTISVNDDLNWITSSALSSAQSPDFPFCDTDVSYIISTTNADFKAVSPSQGNGLVTPSNTTSESATQIDLNFTFNQPVENLRIYVVDLDYNTNNSAGPEEFLSNILVDNNDAVPIVTSGFGGVYWDSQNQIVTPSEENAEGWIEFSGSLSELQFTYNRPGNWFGLIIDSVQFDCTNYGCDCPAMVNYNQLGQIQNNGEAMGKLHINSGSDAISSLTIELPFYEIQTIPECRECDMDNVASHGTIVGADEIDGVSGEFYNPSGNQALGYRKITYNFSSPVVLNEHIKLDLLFPPVLDLNCCANRVNYCFSVTLRKDDCTSCEYSTCSDQSLEGFNVIDPSLLNPPTKPFVDGGMAAEPNVNVRVSLFEVSPNPTHDMINAKIVENSFQSANIELRNSKGQMIDSFVTKSRVFQIPVENAGVYHLTMISNGKKSTKQVVVH